MDYCVLSVGFCVGGCGGEDDIVVCWGEFGVDFGDIVVESVGGEGDICYGWDGGED